MNISAHIPKELAERLRKVRDRVNVSAAARQGIAAAVRREEKKGERNTTA